MFTALTLYVCLGFSFQGLKNHANELMRQGKRHEIILVIFLVQNGLAMYGTWLSVLSCVSVAAFLQYETGLTAAAAAVTGLVILTAKLIVYGALDLHFLERDFRFILTPYIAWIALVSGIISKNWESGEAISIFTTVLLALIIIMTLLKITFTLIRQFKKPIYAKYIETAPLVHEDALNQEVAA